jgi:hypothetical protein
MPPPPFRADQIGSLIRPKYLLDARQATTAYPETSGQFQEESADAKKASQHDWICFLILLNIIVLT